MDMDKRTKEYKRYRRDKHIFLSVCLIMALSTFYGYLIAQAETSIAPVSPPRKTINTTNTTNTTQKKISVKEQIRAIAEEHNFPWIDYLTDLAFCESNYNPKAINTNNGHSTDRGVFQINNYYHQEVSDECAYSVRCSTEWTMLRIQNGYQNEWMCDQIIRPQKYI